MEQKKGGNADLSYKEADSTNSSDSLLSFLREETSLDDERLLGELSLAKNLVVAVLGDIDDGNVSFGELAGEGVVAILLLDESPEMIDVDDGAMVLILGVMVIAHTDLTEVTRMVLVKVDTMMVETTSVTTTSRMLSVFSNTTVTGGNVSALLTILMKTSRLIRIKLMKKKN